MNGAIVPFAPNVFDRDDIDDQFGLLLIEELGSRVGSLPPPVWLPRCRLRDNKRKGRNP